MWSANVLNVKIELFSVGHSAPTVRPPIKLTYKEHTLGISTSPESNSYRPKSCVLSCKLRTSTRPKISDFGGPEKHLRRNLDIFMVACTGTPIHVCCVKNCRNPYRITGHTKNKTLFGSIWRHPWAIFPTFCVIAHCRPLLIVRVSSKSVQILPRPDPQSECNRAIRPCN